MSISLSRHENFPRRGARALLLAGGWSVVCALSARGQNTTNAPAAESSDTQTPATYTINLSPPNVVGQKFMLVTDQSQKMKMHIDAYVLGFSAGKEDGTVETTKHFEAEAEVLEIFPNGGIKKIALTVITLQQTTDGNTTTKLPAGAKIVAEALEPPPPPAPKVKTTIIHGDKGRTSVIKTMEPSPPPAPSTKITVDGQEVNKELFELLNDLVPLSNGKSMKQQELGPPGPVPIGATWPINMPGPKLFYGDKGEKSDGTEIPITASAQLKDVQGAGDQQVVTVVDHFTVKDFKPPIDTGAPIDFLNCAATGNSTETIPAVRTAGVEKSAVILEFTFQAKGGLLGVSAKVAGSGDMKSTTTKTYEAQKPADSPSDQKVAAPVSTNSP